VVKLVQHPIPPNWTWWPLLGGEGKGKIRKGRRGKEKGWHGRGEEGRGIGRKSDGHC